LKKVREKGTYNPSLKPACRTARALNTTIEDLFSCDEDDEE
jgi:DNA-binding XRE family transcriptional regulator